jgi:hypothetical protein
LARKCQKKHYKEITNAAKGLGDFEEKGISVACMI